MLFRRGSIARSGPRSAGELVAWVEAELAGPYAEVPAPPSASVRAPAAGPKAAWRADVEAGPVVAVRARTIGDGDGREFRASFVGVGPSVALSAARGPLHAGLSGSAVEYGISSTRASLGGGNVATLRGGTTLAVEAEGGVWLRGRVGLAFAARLERHDAEEVGDLHLIASHTRIAADLRLAGRLPLSVRGRPWTLDARLGLSPWSAWSEDPAGTSGNRPAPVPAVSAAIGAEADLGRWTGRVNVEIERRRVDFSGAAAAPFVEPMVDARIEETLQLVTVSVGRRF